MIKKLLIALIFNNFLISVELNYRQQIANEVQRYILPALSNLVSVYASVSSDEFFETQKTIVNADKEFEEIFRKYKNDFCFKLTFIKFLQAFKQAYYFGFNDIEFYQPNSLYLDFILRLENMALQISLSYYDYVLKSGIYKKQSNDEALDNLQSKSPCIYAYYFILQCLLEKIEMLDWNYRLK